jgi:hypothetical protein
MVFFVGESRILHLEEVGTGQLGTVATVVITSLINGTVIERAHFVGHHLHRPECGALDIVASVACFVEELAFIAFESAGT